MLLALPAFSTDLTQRNKVMEAMTQQRLQSEITRVQSVVAVIAKQPSLLAAVLIPDALTLANNKQLLDELIASMAFFVVIPLVVMANLDKLKVGNQRVHKGARDVTHVIQAAMAAYNPYIRVQYPKEVGSASVPVDSVPLDEDVTPQALLSCARYFVQQAQGYASVVTILSVDPLVQQLAHREKSESRPSVKFYGKNVN